MNYDRYVTFSKKPHARWFARGFAVFFSVVLVHCLKVELAAFFDA